jgi:hypothetical protein
VYVSLQPLGRAIRAFGRGVIPPHAFVAVARAAIDELAGVAGPHGFVPRVGDLVGAEADRVAAALADPGAPMPAAEVGLRLAGVLGALERLEAHGLFRDDLLTRYWPEGEPVARLGGRDVRVFAAHARGCAIELAEPVADPVAGGWPQVVPAAALDFPDRRLWRVLERP